MKLKNIAIPVLWVSALMIPCSVQADEAAVLRSFMGIMQEAQKQSAEDGRGDDQRRGGDKRQRRKGQKTSESDADPNTAAILEAFGQAIDARGKAEGKGKGRKAKGDRKKRRQN